MLTPNRFVKYPSYPPRVSWVETLLVRLGGGPMIRCAVCGSPAIMEIHGDNLRETCQCRRCHASNRQRQLAYVACEAVRAARGLSISSLKDLARIDDLVVYNTEARGPIHDQLSGMGGYLCSEYCGDPYRSGQVVGGVMHQDLTALSLESQNVDLVLSSEVLEHIPDPYQAHREIHRVLRPGGSHVFTVPFGPTEFLDADWAVVADDGAVVHLREPTYHEDPLRPEGALVYKTFALEMLVKLHRIGFRTKLYHLYRPLYGILGQNALVFDAVKG